MSAMTTVTGPAPSVPTVARWRHQMPAYAANLAAAS